MPLPPAEYTISTANSVTHIGPDAWAQCIATDHPFVQYDVFHAMEASGVIGEDAGWIPHYLIASQSSDTHSSQNSIGQEIVGQNIVGLAPAFLKNHSMGEYVFDHGWADAYHRAGGHYYPKLQVSVPFTPVTGPRLLTPPSEHAQHHKRALLHGLQAMAEQYGLSSIHITFPDEADRAALEDTPFLLREDRQFHWNNANYKTFDDFLADLNSRKRKEVRKERKTAIQNDITIHWLQGDALTDDVWDAFYEFYVDTGHRKWGTPYLNLSFFKTLSQTMADQIVLIMAQRNGAWIAGAMNMVDQSTMYGRYWGCTEHHPCLHFEVCYYQAIEYAIQHGLKRVEAGAQGGHKMARGYVPTPTYSAHWMPNQSFHSAVADYLARERQAVALDSQFLQDRVPFKKDPNAQT